MKVDQSSPNMCLLYIETFIASVQKTQCGMQWVRRQRVKAFTYAFPGMLNVNYNQEDEKLVSKTHTTLILGVPPK